LASRATPSAVSDRGEKERRRYAIAPVAHRVEYRGTKSGRLRNDDAGVEIRGEGEKREEERAYTFPVTLRYKESNSSGEIPVNVNAGSAVR